MCMVNVSPWRARARSTNWKGRFSQPIVWSARGIRGPGGRALPRASLGTGAVVAVMGYPTVFGYRRECQARRGLRARNLADRARARADVPGGRPDEARLALLLEDVRRPARDARAREHRGEELRRDLGGVEHDGRQDLDVGGQHAVGTARLELGQRRLLERLGDLE